MVEKRIHHIAKGVHHAHWGECTTPLCGTFYPGLVKGECSGNGKGKDCDWFKKEAPK